MMPTPFQPFLADLAQRGLSERTITGYAQDMARFAAWFAQTNQVALTPLSITPQDIRQYKAHLAASQAAGATINRWLAAVRAYLRWCADAHGVVITIQLKPVKTQRPQIRWLDKADQGRLTRTVERALTLARLSPCPLPPGRQLQAVRDYAITTLLLHTGLRVAELCHLTLADMQLNDRKGRVSVRRGKGGRDRQVPLNYEATQAMHAWLAVRPTHKSDRLFTGKRAGLTPLGVQRALHALGQQARLTSVPSLTPHALRHTFGKNLADKGVPIERIAELLGHSSVDITRIYVAPSWADLEAAVTY